MLFSASYAYAYYQMGDSFHYIKRQLIFAVAGVVAMVVFSMIDYHVWQRFVMYIYGISLVLLVVVLFMEPINNAKRWIILELPGLSFTFQPSEIAKFAIIVLFSHIISVNYDKMKTFKFGILPFGLALVPIVVLMVMEPHLSGTILILAIGAKSIKDARKNMEFIEKKIKRRSPVKIKSVNYKDFEINLCRDERVLPTVFRKTI